MLLPLEAQSGYRAALKCGSDHQWQKYLKVEERASAAANSDDADSILASSQQWWMRYWNTQGLECTAACYLFWLTPLLCSGLLIVTSLSKHTPTPTTIQPHTASFKPNWIDYNGISLYYNYCHIILLFMILLFMSSSILGKNLANCIDVLLLAAHLKKELVFLHSGSPGGS